MNVPVCLVTGFLGCGKTTLLSRIIERNRERRLIYLVNEFSEVDIDGQRLGLPADRLIALPGGSIFCRCLTADFIRTLRDIETRFNAGASQTEGVVIETSGIANPKVIRQMLEETKLDRVYELRRIVTIIEPGSFLKLIHTLPNIKQQVDASDLVILNKIDLYPPEQIEQAEAEVKIIHPDAVIEKTQFCRFDFDPFVGTVDKSLTGEYAPCADPNYASSSVCLKRPIDWKRLKAAFVSIQDDLFRVKGFVRTSDRILYIDYSEGGWREENEENTATRDHFELVFVLKGRAALTSSALAARINSGEFDLK